jgi:glycosyltransferase involved in cell wall biosynthesis
LETQPSLNIIVPCYNPQKQDWAQHLVAQYLSFKKCCPLKHVNMVLINDGSTMNVSASEFRFLKSEIHGLYIVDYAENKGKGYALRQGVGMSNADLNIFTDIDFPYTIDSMLALTEALIAKGGIAAGNRNASYYQKVPFIRKVISKVFRLVIRFIGIPVDDTQCGLKGFDTRGRDVFLDTKIDRFLFDLEFLLLASRKNIIPIYSVPVQLNDGVVFSQMGFGVLRTEFWNFIKVVLKKI